MFATDFNFAAPLPFTPADIAGLVATPKSIQPSSIDALTYHEQAQVLLNSYSSTNLPQVFEQSVR